MSLNDKDPSLYGARGVDIHPGVANPTVSSTHADPLAANFVTDPTDPTPGAGAGPNFRGHEDAQRTFKQSAGVVEGRPGIIETTNIDPLNENSNKDDGWANATRSTGSSTGTSGGGSSAQGVLGTASGYAASAASTAAGAARLAYGHATGDEQAKQAGREAIWGKGQ
ncbi:hypothetical protein C8Q75DRAFT_751706 [Abortiporus biennis]|nr:hypothetical protein C8Q75DRAFT_751706 [Abortiporus biennis]